MLLSDQAGPKLRLACSRCGLRRQYDIAELMRRIGDQKMPSLIPEIARRNGCNVIPAPTVYDRCQLRALKEE